MILIVGLPLFAKRLANDLRSVDPSVRVIALDTYTSRMDKLRFMLLLPFAKTVISMNGATDKSGSLDWVIRLRKKLVLQWMGTDILIAMQHANEGNQYRKYVDYASNFADSEWMQRELKEAGIKADILYFKYAEHTELRQRPYTDLRVLSYIPQRRQEFYGMEGIADLARRFPEIVFEIIGTSECDYPHTENMIFSGWVSEADVKGKMQESAVFLRLTEHDGFSSSVIEALSYGCEVLWTFPFGPTIYVDDRTALPDRFAEAVKRVNERQLYPAAENRDFVLERFGREKILKTYLDRINRQ